MALAAMVASCSGDGTAAVSSTREPTTAPLPPTSDVVVRLKQVHGEIRVQRIGSTRWALAAQDMELAPGDAVQALIGGHATLDLGPAAEPIQLESGTTVQIPAKHSVKPLVGRLVVRVSADREPRELIVLLPPGALVLHADPNGQKVVEAVVAVDANGSSIEMLAGSGVLKPDANSTMKIDALRWMRFRRDGTLDQQGSSGMTAKLLHPAMGAKVRTSGEVELRWESIPTVDGYTISMSSGAVSRRIDVVTPSSRLRFVAGSQTWTVQGRRGKELLPPAPTHAFEVELDDRVSLLAILEPPDNARVTGPQIQISGRTEPGAAIEVGMVKTRADHRGVFRIDVPILRGLSNLVVKARDDLGNERRLSRSVIWQ